MTQAGQKPRALLNLGSYSSQDLHAHLMGWDVGWGRRELAPTRFLSCQLCSVILGWFLGLGSPSEKAATCRLLLALWPPEQHVLEELERQAVLVYTPSRKVNGKRVVCYDDRYIVKVAYACDGIIVSNDNYRDLQSENPEWKWFIEQRLLMFSFVNDRYVVTEGAPARRGGTDWQKATPTSLGPVDLQSGTPQWKQRTPSPGGSWSEVSLSAPRDCTVCLCSSGSPLFCD